MEKNILSPEDASSMFLNLKDIIANNQTYLQLIREPFIDYKFYKVILKYSVAQIDNFMIYFAYCNGYT